MARILMLLVSFLLTVFGSSASAGVFETEIASMIKRMEDGKETFLISRRSKDGMEILVSKPYRSENPKAVFVFNPGISNAKRPDFRFGLLYAMGESEPMAVLARWDFLSGKVSILEDEWSYVGGMPSEVESALKSSSTEYASPKIPNAEAPSAKTTLATVYQTLLAKDVLRLDAMEFPAKVVFFHPYPLPSYGYGDRSFITINKTEEGKSRFSIAGIDCKKRSMAYLASFEANGFMPKTDDEFRKELAKSGFKPKGDVSKELVKSLVKDFCSR